MVGIDGSCLHGNGSLAARAGFGVYFGSEDPRNIWGPVRGQRQTSARAETKALLTVLESTVGDIEVCCDNKGVVNRAKNPNWKDRHKHLDADLWERIATLISGRNVAIHWIRSHNSEAEAVRLGFPKEHWKANDGADKIANLGAEMHTEKGGEWGPADAMAVQTMQMKILLRVCGGEEDGPKELKKPKQKTLTGCHKIGQHLRVEYGESIAKCLDCGKTAKNTSSKAVWFTMPCRQRVVPIYEQRTHSFVANGLSPTGERMWICTRCKLEATKGIFTRRRNELCSKEVRPGEQAPINLLLTMGNQAAQDRADAERRIRSVPDPPVEEGVRMVKGHRYAATPGREGYVSCKSCGSTKQSSQLNMANTCAYTPEFAEGNNYVWVAHVSGHRVMRNQGEPYSATCTRCGKQFRGRRFCPPHHLLSSALWGSRVLRPRPLNCDS